MSEGKRVERRYWIKERGDRRNKREEEGREKGERKRGERGGRQEKGESENRGGERCRGRSEGREETEGVGGDTRMEREEERRQRGKEVT